MNDFEKRYNQNKDELNSLLKELYPNIDTDLVLKHLEPKWRLRRISLKQSDAKRLENNNSWYKQSDNLGLSLYVDLFSNDLKGLIKKIPYLKKMKVKTLFLMPIFSKPKKDNDSGFAVTSFSKVDRTLGNNKDFSELTKALRKNKIALSLELPLNHTSSNHIWAKKAIDGDKTYQDYYIMLDTKQECDEYEKNLEQALVVTSNGNFTYNEKLDKYIWTTFHSYQWDLNYKNPDVLLHIIDSMLYLANLGVDIIRLGSISYIYKELNTNCQNLKQVHLIIRILRLALEIVAPGVIISGDVRQNTKTLVSYFGTNEKGECHLLYSNNAMANLWSSLASKDIRVFKEYLNYTSNVDNCFINYLRHHDDIGWGLDDYSQRKFFIDPSSHREFLCNFFSGNIENSYASGELYNYDKLKKDARNCGTTASLCGLETSDKESAVKRILLLHATSYFLRSFFMINSGDEIGLTNNYDYVNDSDKALDSRNLHRVKFTESKTKESTIIFDTLLSFIKARKELKAFNYESSFSTWDANNNSVLALKRNYDDNEILLFANFSDENQDVKTEYLFGTYYDYFTNNEYTPGVGFTLKPYQYLYLVKKDK